MSSAAWLLKIVSIASFIAVVRMRVPPPASNSDNKACSPGTFPMNSSNTTLCQCGNIPEAIDDSIVGAEWNYLINLYNGIAFCRETENGLRAYVRKSYWAGYYNKNTTSRCHLKDVLIVTLCPDDVCSIDRSSDFNEGVELKPGFNSDEVFCASKHRKDLLCSRCIEGYGVAINSFLPDCANCSSGPSPAANVLIWILTEILPEVVLVFVYVIVDVPLLKGQMNSFLLFVHTFRAMNVYANGILDLTRFHNNPATSLSPWITWVYSLWSLNFIASAPFFPPLCVSPKHDTFSPLTKLSVQYVVAFLPFSLLFLVYILRWCYRSEPLCLGIIFRGMQKVHNCIARIQHFFGKSSSSVRNGFASFLLLVYSKVCFVSFYIIATETLTTSCTVVYLDPYLTPFDENHRSHAVLACIAIILFVICPILVLLFYKPLAIRLKRDSVSDTANGNQTHKCLACKKQISMFFKFLDTFSEGFQEKYAFFGGILFLYRAVMWVIFTNTPTTSLQYMTQICITFLLLLLHLACWPYKRSLRWINRLDAMMYMNIILISSLSLYNYSLLLSSQNPLVSIYVLQQFCVILPMFYPIGVFIVYLVRVRKGKTKAEPETSVTVDYGTIGHVLPQEDLKDVDDSQERRFHFNRSELLSFSSSMTRKGESLKSGFLDFFDCCTKKKQRYDCQGCQGDERQGTELLSSLSQSQTDGKVTEVEVYVNSISSDSDSQLIRETLTD